jgi:hypothetical protein
MPFASKAQQRAAFGGHIPGFTRAMAKEWAKETDFSELPAKAGKTTTKKAGVPGSVGYAARKIREQLISSGTGKNVLDAMAAKKDREKRKIFALIEVCTKLAFAVPAPGKIMQSARNVGSFSGKATTNFLKPTGAISTSVTNPRISVRSAMTKTVRTPPISG